MTTAATAAAAVRETVEKLMDTPRLPEAIAATRARARSLIGRGPQRHYDCLVQLEEASAIINVIDEDVFGGNMYRWLGKTRVYRNDRSPYVARYSHGSIVLNCRSMSAIEHAAAERAATAAILDLKDPVLSVVHAIERELVHLLIGNLWKRRSMERHGKEFRRLTKHIFNHGWGDWAVLAIPSWEASGRDPALFRLRKRSEGSFFDESYIDKVARRLTQALPARPSDIGKANVTRRLLEFTKEGRSARALNSTGRRLRAALEGHVLVTPEVVASAVDVIDDHLFYGQLKVWLGDAKKKPDNDRVVYEAHHFADRFVISCAEINRNTELLARWTDSDTTNEEENLETVAFIFENVFFRAFVGLRPRANVMAGNMFGLNWLQLGLGLHLHDWIASGHDSARFSEKLRKEKVPEEYILKVTKALEKATERAFPLNKTPPPMSFKTLLTGTLAAFSGS